MVKIKHFALTTREPGKTAEFYKEVFGLEEVRRDAKGQVFLSDGDFNIAILNFKTEDDADLGANGLEFGGIHHIGFLVEDIDSFAEKVNKAGGKQLTPTMMPGTGGLFNNGEGRSNAEVKFSGPDGVIIDMSESGWQIAP
jgi:predicted enzyme related to lactoylglutathione lyase